jgi:hypothetical protein
MCDRCYEKDQNRAHYEAQKNGRKPKDTFYYVLRGWEVISQVILLVLTVLLWFVAGAVVLVLSPIWVPIYVLGYLLDHYS